MARPVRGCPADRLQQEGAEEPERDPWQEGQQDTTEGKDIPDYYLDADYVGSKPKAEPVTQDEREVDPDAMYAKMDFLCDESFCQRMMPWEQYKGILWLHRA